MSQYLEPHFHLASINFLGFVEKFPQIFHFLYQSFDSLFRNFLLVLWFRFELQKFRKLKFFAKASAMTRPVRMIRFLKRYDLHVTDRQLFAPQKGFKFIFYIESKFFIFREIHIIFTISSKSNFVFRKWIEIFNFKLNTDTFSLSRKSRHSQFLSKSRFSIFVVNRDFHFWVNRDTLGICNSRFLIF